MSDSHSILLSNGIRIGKGLPCFLAAELGNNHQGDMAMARDMVHAAAESGANGVKFQKRDMASLLTCEAASRAYSGPNSFGATYGEHRNALELSMEELGELKELSESLGLVFFASAWDMVSFHQMEELDVSLHKICSADLVNIPFLRACVASSKPLILSTGMSGLDEIDLAVAELRPAHKRLILLHCNASYPCADQDIHLGLMGELEERYGLPTGYSGHEQGLGPSVAAAALGACVIERHFTLDRTHKGTDHKASLEPAEFRQLAVMIRELEAACAPGGKVVTPQERDTANKLRKSIVFSRDLPAGHTLRAEDLAVKCPGTGVSPVQWDAVPGTVLGADVRRDELFDWSLVTSR